MKNNAFKTTVILIVLSITVLSVYAAVPADSNSVATEHGIVRCLFDGMTNLQKIAIVCVITGVPAVIIWWLIMFLACKKDTKSIKTLFADLGLLKLLTVPAVIFATVVLVLCGVLNEPATAILSGVVGYVLGTSGKHQVKTRTYFIVPFLKVVPV